MALAHALPHLPALHTLELQDCQLGDQAACAIADALTERLDKGGVEEMEETNQVGCSQGVLTAESPGCHEALYLRRLCLGSNPIGDSGCEAIARALTASHRLFAPPARWPLERHMRWRHGLCILQLGDTAIGDAGAAALARALQTGAMQPAGQQLWLAATHISDAGRAQLMLASVSNPTLRICW